MINSCSFVNLYYYSRVRLKKKEIYKSNKVFFNDLQQELIRIRRNSESCNDLHTFKDYFIRIIWYISLFFRSLLIYSNEKSRMMTKREIKLTTISNKKIKIS